MPDGTDPKAFAAPPPAEGKAAPGPEPLPPGEVASSLRHSVRDACGNAVMLGTGEQNLQPFAVFLGASPAVLGLLTTLPAFLGALAQILSVRLLVAAPRRKPYVTVPALAQALAWIPIAALPLAFPGQGPWILLACALLYFSVGNFLVPAWNAWMGDLVPPDGRGAYFAHRDRVRLIFQLASLVAAGLLLDRLRGLGAVAWGFVAVFAAALLGRLVSARELRKMSEPPRIRSSEEEPFTFFQFLRRTPKSNFGRFVIFQALYLSTTGIAGPFFAPFMLEDLHLSYTQYMAVSATFILFMVLTLPAWGRIGDRFGNRRILEVTSILISVLPMSWAVWTWYPYLVLFQVFGGALWAGFNLASFNFFFDTVSPGKRPRCVAYTNTIIAFAVLLGGIAGGWLAPRLPSFVPFLSWEVLPLKSPLQFLFVLSGLLRLLVTVLFLRSIREAREVEGAGWREILQSLFGETPPREREP